MADTTSTRPEDRPVGKKVSALRALWPFVKPYRANLIAAGFALVFTAAVALTLSIAARLVVDTFGLSSGEIAEHFNLMLLIAVLLAFGTATRYYLVTRLGERVVADIRKEVFDDIGLFDENFFLYFEEVDLCRRARQHGWTTHFVPSSRVVHLGSVSTGMGTWTRIPQYWLDSRLYYFEKHFGKFYVTLATLLLFAGGSLARLRYLLGGPRHTGPNGFQVDLLAHFIRNIWRPRPPAVTTKSIVPIVE